MKDVSMMDEALANASSATSYRLSRALATAFPARVVLETDEGDFDPWRFAEAGECGASVMPAMHSQLESGLERSRRGSWTVPENAFLDVTWKGHSLTLVTAHWTIGYAQHRRRWVIAETIDVAKAFFVAVTEWCHTPRREILVFNGGCWSRSATLWDAISRASFDDLILAGSLKDEIRRDFDTFLAARAEYEKYGVPWKRGVLLVGPPGNGKTHCLRAVVKFLSVPCLYVQSLKSPYETDDANISRVFAEARTHSPCCMVFEDLDAMITAENRSYFLNQLDGFSENPGILTIATTNHPERLDPAILSRPSRFDRTYNFGPPEPTERHAYLRTWNARFEPSMRVSDAFVETLVTTTEGFSFAYLKELLVSSMVRWMAKKEVGSMPDVIVEQLTVLKAQMPVIARTPEALSNG